ncbi:hypothetical protein WJX81_007722 [Elliptochloris bilobata]|uniref:Bystin n=1 Tax=Elliptochloris bilobata TaxID=381761 RepID=A0AAW1S4T1_9CHLO
MRRKKAVKRAALPDELENPETYGVRVKPRRSKKARDSDGEDAEEVLTPELSSRILREAQAQQAEVDAEADLLGAGGARAASSGRQEGGCCEAGRDSDSDSDPGEDVHSEVDEAWVEEHVSAEDEAALAAFLYPDAASQQQRTLNDIIMSKIRERQATGGLASVPEEGEGMVPAGLDPKVVEVYTAVGKILSRYSAGKIPKAFKIVPTLTNWEEVLYLTDPEHWSPHAVYQATRLFVSSMNARLAQRFLALVLLPHVRQDIREHRRLHFALFQAMKKAAYKPDAFYKGLLLPLCASGTCTLREAVIVSSVLRRVSVPVLHSAAALLRLAEMPYSGTTSFFIRVLLDKKYALPYRVVDALVDHFVRFRREERTLPVVWHQALLCFVQRYKNEIRAEDKEALRRLIKSQFHYQVTPEVLREIDASRSRGEQKEGLAEAMQVQARVSTKTAEDPRNLPSVLIMDED